MSAPRVLQLAKFYPPEHGGIEAVVQRLSEELHARQWPLTVLCAHRHWRSRDETTPSGIRVVRAGAWGTLLSTSVAPSLMGWTRRLAAQAHIVHVHMPNPLAALALWRARPTARLVVHWHSDVVSQPRALHLYEPLQRWLLARADAVVATSPVYLEHSPALQPWRAKVAVIPLGICDNACLTDPARVAALRARWPGRKIILALGRMAPYKGFDVLVEAAARLPDEAVVLVAGGGALLPRHRARVQALGLGARVHFLGPVSDDELHTLHCAADIFCMPSLSRAEAFGVAQLEAMCAARPVVCSDVPGSGLAWVNRAGETGLTVPPGSPDALAAALGRLLGDDALRMRLGAAARRRYLDHFTASAMVDATAALYRRLTTGPT